MRTRISWTLLLGFSTMCTGACAVHFDATQEELSSLVHGNGQFACDLYAQLRTCEGNLFFSPESISLALAMTYGGAAGETRTQMRQVLRFPEKDEVVHRCFAVINRQWNESGRKGVYKLCIANRLWGQDAFPFRDTFLKLTRDYYDAEMALVNFKGASEAARATINQWVAKKTEDKIPTLLNPGVVVPKTRLILTNAIYFNGNWASQFKTQATKQEPFYVTPETTVDVAMMNQTARFAYAQQDDAQILAMPYTGEDLSMIIVLPQQRDGLAALEQSLSPERLEGWLKALQPTEVQVYVPKFKMDAEFELRNTLVAMGMVRPFTNIADFSGMVDDQKLKGDEDPLFISDVIHKAYVDVNEEGTEAAAATAVVMKMSDAYEPPPPTFRADHPFLFLIRDTHTGSILFLGRFTKPA